MKHSGMVLTIAGGVLASAIMGFSVLNTLSGVASYFFELFGLVLVFGALFYAANRRSFLRKGGTTYYVLAILVIVTASFVARWIPMQLPADWALGLFQDTLPLFVIAYLDTLSLYLCYTIILVFVIIFSGYAGFTKGKGLLGFIAVLLLSPFLSISLVAFTLQFFEQGSPASAAVASAITALCLFLPWVLIVFLGNGDTSWRGFKNIQNRIDKSGPVLFSLLPYAVLCPLVTLFLGATGWGIEQYLLITLILAMATALFFVATRLLKNIEVRARWAVVIIGSVLFAILFGINGVELPILLLLDSTWYIWNVDVFFPLLRDALAAVAFVLGKFVCSFCLYLFLTRTSGAKSNLDNVKKAVLSLLIISILVFVTNEMLATSFDYLVANLMNLPRDVSDLVSLFITTTGTGALMYASYILVKYQYKI